MKPDVVEVTRTDYGGVVTMKIKQIPLSNDTIRACIYDMSNDIKQQVIAAMKTSGQVTLQLHKSTGLSDDALLMAFIRYRRAKIWKTRSLRAAAYYHKWRQYFQDCGFIHQG